MITHNQNQESQNHTREQNYQSPLKPIGYTMHSLQTYQCGHSLVYEVLSLVRIANNHKITYTNITRYLGVQSERQEKIPDDFL